MKPVELADGIYDVGVLDWNIRDFHGYSTDRGTSYNAFLILDEKITLIDTVKAEFADQLLENIGALVDPKSIDYVISNHTELDHSGGLARILHKIGEHKPLYCSKMGAKNLACHFPQKWNYRAVASGEELRLGRRTLTFLETRMLHWPDSMFTYAREDKILFSSDAFGQHYAGHEKFDDVIGDAVLPHARKYFANILLPYASLVLKLIEQVASLGLDFKMICPDHGIIWRRDPAKIIQAYAQWSRQTPANKAVVVYDTMWHSTEKMAEAITAGLLAEGIDAKPMHLRKWHRSDIMTEVTEAAAVVIGSPTLNNGLFPTVSDFLTYMKGLRPQNKIGAAFGSYGWSGDAPRLIAREFEAMKIKLAAPELKLQYRPDNVGRQACHELGVALGRAVRAATAAK